MGGERTRLKMCRQRRRSLRSGGTCPTIMDFRHWTRSIHHVLHLKRSSLQLYPYSLLCLRQERPPLPLVASKILAKVLMAPKANTRRTYTKHVEHRNPQHRPQLQKKINNRLKGDRNQTTRVASQMRIAVTTQMPGKIQVHATRGKARKGTNRATPRRQANLYQLMLRIAKGVRSPMVSSSLRYTGQRLDLASVCLSQITF